MSHSHKGQIEYGENSALAQSFVTRIHIAPLLKGYICHSNAYLSRKDTHTALTLTIVFRLGAAILRETVFVVVHRKSLLKSFGVYIAA